MATDLKLDQQGGNWLIAESNIFKSTATDFMLDSPLRRSAGSTSLHRRALVHDFGDRLTINYAGDYPGGVMVMGGLSVGGELTVGGKEMKAALTQLEGAVSAASAATRLDRLETLVDLIMERIGAAIIPDWKTQEEVEHGDDMGLSVRSAADLGLIVQYQVDQANPAFGDGQVISIAPSPGTLVSRGSTVVVWINLAG